MNIKSAHITLKRILHDQNKKRFARAD